MINIPKTLCKCPDKKTSNEIVIVLPPVSACEETRCDPPEAVGLVPILKTLCSCPPVPEVVINYSPKPRRTKVVKTCFVDFIKNITSTKFCDNGPTCTAS